MSTRYTSSSQPPPFPLANLLKKTSKELNSQQTLAHDPQGPNRTSMISSSSDLHSDGSLDAFYMPRMAVMIESNCEDDPKRIQIIREIYNTEKRYGDDLLVLYQRFYLPLVAALDAG